MTLMRNKQNPINFVCLHPTSLIQTMYMLENSPKGEELSILSVVNMVTNLKIVERQRKIVIKPYY